MVAIFPHGAFCKGLVALCHVLRRPRAMVCRCWATSGPGWPRYDSGLQTWVPSKLPPIAFFCSVMRVSRLSLRLSLSFSLYLSRSHRLFQTLSDSLSLSHRLSLRLYQTLSDSLADSHRLSLRLSQTISQTLSDSLSDSLRLLGGVSAASRLSSGS